MADSPSYVVSGQRDADARRKKAADAAVQDVSYKTGAEGLGALAAKMKKPTPRPTATPTPTPKPTTVKDLSVKLTSGKKSSGK